MALANKELGAGDVAPDFTLPVTQGGDIDTFSLASKAGSPVVLFFYPKDNTPGCTTEAMDFTAHLSEFDKLGVSVFGMSPDPAKKHIKFQEKHALGMPLIADEEQTALTAYGVWKEKSMYGKKYMGVERSTFLIGKDGKLLRIWRKVKVAGHVAEVLEAAKELV